MKTAERSTADTVRRAIDGPRLTLQALGERAGLTVPALNAYRLGIRTPDDEKRLRLAAALEAFALDVRGLAEDLRASVEE